MSVNKLLIVGAGGFGREVHRWLSDWVLQNQGWKIAGFINDGPGSVARFSHYPPVVSSIDEYQPEPDEHLLCAIGSPADRRKVVEKLQAKGARFFTLIHPSAIVGENVAVGQGAIICPLTVLTADLIIGDFAILNISCVVGHDAAVGAFSTLSPHCNVAGAGVLEDEVFMGTNACVLPGVRVGHQSVIGAGSVVLRNVASCTTAFGVPAKSISR